MCLVSLLNRGRRFRFFASCAQPAGGITVVSGVERMVHKLRSIWSLLCLTFAIRESAGYSKVSKAVSATRELHIPGGFAGRSTVMRKRFGMVMTFQSHVCCVCVCVGNDGSVMEPGLSTTGTGQPANQRSSLTMMINRCIASGLFPQRHHHGSVPVGTYLYRPLAPSFAGDRMMSC